MFPNHALKRSSLTLAAVILAGCQYDPYSSGYTTKQPKTNDIVGVYVPDSNTVALISGQGHYGATSPSIELLNDGTVIITNIPDWWLTFGQPHGGFDSGRGTWDIQMRQKWWALAIDFKETAQFASQTNKPTGLSTEMMLIGEKPPYTIHLIVGDPDGGRGMEFVKKQEAP